MLLSPLPLSVHRTPTRADAQISPFLLDPSTITYHAHKIANRHTATWLHLPVLARLVPSRAAALHAVQVMSCLRHPNVEQLLGAVVSDRPAILTEHVPGPPLVDALSAPPALRAEFVAAHALSVLLDVARALVYLHATAGAHGGVCAGAVLFDAVRCRAVLLLRAEGVGGCATPEGGVSEEGDVYCLGELVVEAFKGRAEGGEGVQVLPGGLREIVGRCLREVPGRRPRVEEVCQALTDCCEVGDR